MIKQLSNNSNKFKISNKLSSIQEYLSGSTSGPSTRNLRYQTYQLNSKDKLLKMQSETWYKCLSLLVYIIAVFGCDFKNIVINKKYDVYPSSIFIVVCIYLIGEIVIKCYVEEHNYIFGFYFWLDVLAIIALILDLHWLYDMIAEKMLLISKDKWHLYRNVLRNLKIYSRITNIITILCVNFQQRKKDLNDSSMDFEKLIKQRNLLIAILTAITIAVMNPRLYQSDQVNINQFTTSVNSFKYIDNNDIIKNTFNFMTTFYAKTDTPLLYARIYDNIYKADNSDKYKVLRPLEYVYYSIDCDGREDNYSLPDYIQDYEKENSDGTFYQCIALFDNSKPMKMVYTFSILYSLFSVLILFISVILMRNSIHDIALNPIKQMAEKIKNLSLNPASALQDNLVLGKKGNYPIEITQLVNTITKICGLLILGYGEAGAGIISTVMKEANGGEVNPKLFGSTIMAIYGFCDIRNFTDTTEVLQEQVMIFVNEVAHIVHSITADCMGSANKNIGDAFLLVWKFDKKHTIKNAKGELVLLNNREVNQIVDLALVAFLKIIIQINKSSKLRQYKKNRMLNQRIPNYAVKMGFGLHLGYSIEGAIGSGYKIDASYLSPNVERAGEIQERTKDYGKDLILSKDFVNYLSPEAKKNVRLLGGVGNDSVFTVDLDLSGIEKEKNVIDKNEFEDLNTKLEHLQRRREMYKKKFEDCVKYKKNIWNEYAMKDCDIVVARAKFDERLTKQKEEMIRHHKRKRTDK